MDSSFSKIKASGVVMVVMNSMLGAGILTLPRTISQAVGTPDAWISIILSGLMVTGIGLLLVFLCRKFPGKTVFEFIPEIIGKWLSYLLGIFIILYFTILCSFEIRVMAEITDMYLLDRTPTWASIMVIMWVGIYMITGGITVMIRVFAIILPITLALFLLVMLLSSQTFELNHLRPVLGQGIVPVLKGIKPSFLSYSGYEVVLITTAYMANIKDSNKAVYTSISIVTLIYLVTIIMVIGSLSLEGAEARTWPTFDMVRSFEMEGFLFERFESQFLIFWLVQIFATYVFKHYFASVGIRDIFGIKKIKTIQFILLPVLYIISYLPKDLDQTLALGDLLGDISVLLFGIIPVMLLIVSFIRKRGGSKSRRSKTS
ncbi:MULTISPECIES: GerAB/ArcD/ProY family transporter [Paenibacillus]|uniref:GerAB/ArcD/ProY family transporter n=1 Tax=Paenibacillus TaxID=44249 RepID=UPI000371889D|nr:GerAB/ArcD/ProY family transporter [Paenibacillus massiliensis]